MRDRLIDLLRSIPNMEPQCRGREQGKTYLTAAYIADHLLANGVIVPPVELGSRNKVYYPVKGTGVVYGTKVYGMGIDEDGDMVINPREYPEKVITIIGYKIGETVFTTREEAEKALAERSGE